MRGEFKGFFILKQIKKPWLSSVIGYVSCLSVKFFRALAAFCVFQLQQNRAQSTLLYSLIKKQFAVNNLNLFLPLNEKQKEAAIIEIICGFC